MKSLCVYLVRHAESANNARGEHDVSLSDLPACGDGDGASSPAKRAKKSPSARQADPGLTEKGHAQARAVGKLMLQLQKDERTPPELRPQHLCVSGVKRALQTCRHVSEATGLAPSLELSMHEEGGVFEGNRREAREQTAGGVYVHPPRYGLDAPGMEAHLPGLSGLEAVAERGWWRGGVESVQEAAERASTCVRWLWQLVDAKGNCADPARGSNAGAVVCVSHGLFMDRWLKTLMGLVDASSASFLTANCAYWLLKLCYDPSNSQQTRRVVFLACNVVDHVPMAIRTGHKMGSMSHCQPSYPDLLSPEDAARDRSDACAEKPAS